MHAKLSHAAARARARQMAAKTKGYSSMWGHRRATVSTLETLRTMTASVVIPGSATAVHRAKLDKKRTESLGSKGKSLEAMPATWISAMPTREERAQWALVRKPGKERSTAERRRAASVSCIERRRAGLAEPPTSTPLHEWTAEDVRNVLRIFQMHDADSDGKLNGAEFDSLCAAFGMTASIEDADTVVKDGLIDPHEFFALAQGCSVPEAKEAFTTHALLFEDAAKRARPFREWAAADTAAVLEVFFMFDRDGSGTIDASELQAICDVLMVDHSMLEFDRFIVDGCLDPLEFFCMYTGASREEGEMALKNGGWGVPGYTLTSV